MPRPDHPKRQLLSQLIIRQYPTDIHKTNGPSKDKVVSLVTSVSMTLKNLAEFTIQFTTLQEIQTNSSYITSVCKSEDQEAARQGQVIAI